MDKGVSPVVSYVLILAILVTIAVGSYLWASYMQTQMQDKITVSTMESQMVGIENLIENVAHGDMNYTLTQTMYVPNGMLDVQPEKDWIRFLAQTHSLIYNPTKGYELQDQCGDVTTIQDTDTMINLTRMPFTNVFRGATGNALGERVEIVTCFPDVDLVTGEGCIGRSGPVIRIKAKKVGYSGEKPRVMVEIC